MRLTVRALGFSLTPAMRDRAIRRVQTALGRFASRLGRIHVRLSDVNGPRGGNDKRCHVHMVVPGGREISVHELHTDLYAAIDLAMARAAESMSRALGRKTRAA
jgi:putative sigma-54 modulation protein